MAEAIVSIVVESLASLAIKEMTLSRGRDRLMDDIQDAQRELETIISYLKDAHARQRNDQVVRDWVAIIRDAACDLEDIVESYLLKEASRRNGSSMQIIARRMACIGAVDLGKTESQIRWIRFLLSALNSAFSSYGIVSQVPVDNDSVTPVRNNPILGRTSSHAPAYSHIIERTVVVGRDKDVCKLVSHLFGGENSRTPVRNNSILGRTSSHPPTYSHVIERTVVIGRDKDVCRLVSHLFGGENSRTVVSVWGMAGVGKTTIAKQVFHDDRVRTHFECLAWVWLPLEFQSRDVFQDILTQLISATDEERREFTAMNALEIAQLLCDTQQRKKCFIVLDDICTDAAWNSLKLAFPGEGTKSKILLTCRSKELALHAAGGEGGFLYQAQPLTDHESWKLFEEIAIPGPDGQIDSIGEKKKLGRKLVERCQGLPLAIMVLAGLLASKNTVEEWLTVSELIDSNLHIESRYGGASWVLTISYDNLPGRLQICFQYLSNFPKGYEIPIKTLTRLWIAEGLIAPISSESVVNIEDVSYGYLNELAERSMVQVVKRSLNGNIKTICLHDLLLDLSLEMAEREDFLHVVNSSEAKETQTSLKKIRRLAFHLEGIGHELVLPSEKRHASLRSLLVSVGHYYSDIYRKKRHASLRSLLFFVGGHYYSDIYRKLLRSLCNFKFLRVLKFEDMKAEPEVELPSSIGDLVLLRFLSLKNSEIKRLPSSVANLVCLQTLDLRSVEWVSVEIPNVFWKMVKLRHLYLPLNHRVTEKLSLATLRNLQTVANISTQDCDLKDLIELANLRKLVMGARDLTEFKPLEEIMLSSGITFDHLQSLSLVIGNGNGDIPTHLVLSCPHLLKLQLYGRIREFPDNDHFSNLIKLTLEETNLQACHISRLENLTTLKALSLRMGAFKSETMVFSKEGFPQLEFLSMLGLCELQQWTVEEGAMPRLNSLYIGYCWRLKAVPEGLQHISTLKELTIERMYHEFCKRLEKGGADFEKFRHASVTITNKR